MVRYERSDEVTWDDAGDRVVILDAEGATIITLNPVGSLLWRRIDSACTADDLVDHLSSTFPDVERAQLATDVEEFVSQLVGENLLRTVS